jgi:hypothetical protein
MAVVPLILDIIKVLIVVRRKAYLMEDNPLPSIGVITSPCIVWKPIRRVK